MLERAPKSWLPRSSPSPKQTSSASNLLSFPSLPLSFVSSSSLPGPAGTVHHMSVRLRDGCSFLVRCDFSFLYRDKLFRHGM
ncbi:hypothetical protein AAC387_Pa11g1920 [Persea americana]